MVVVVCVAVSLCVRKMRNVCDLFEGYCVMLHDVFRLWLIAWCCMMGVFVLVCACVIVCVRVCVSVLRDVLCDSVCIAYVCACVWFDVDLSVCVCVFRLWLIV